MPRWSGLVGWVIRVLAGAGIEGGISGARQTSDRASAGALKIALIHSHKEGASGPPVFDAQNRFLGYPPSF